VTLSPLPREWERKLIETISECSTGEPRQVTSTPPADQKLIETISECSTMRTTPSDFFSAAHQSAFLWPKFLLISGSAGLAEAPSIGVGVDFDDVIFLSIPNTSLVLEG
jgi:hypothetical protein